MKENIRLYSRLAREGGLTWGTAAAVLGLKAVATIFEGVGVAMLIPVFEAVGAGVVATGLDPARVAREAQEAGAGEILVTSIERDGLMQGYDIELIRTVTSAVSIPVIASGGAGEYRHLAEALDAGGASAVAAASIFHFTEQTPAEAKSYLMEAGFPVRR